VIEPGRRDRRRRGRGGRLLRPLLALGLLLVAFGIGVALGEALHDNPKPGGTVTYVRTLPPESVSRP
jgi:hypothetical protein